jgi:hypothetical protein
VEDKKNETASTVNEIFTSEKNVHMSLVVSGVLQLRSRFIVTKFGMYGKIMLFLNK